MTGPLETQYGPAVDAAADAVGVPRDALRAIVWIESSWDPHAFLAEQGGAGSGSYGLMQVTLDTARGMGFTGDPAGLFDPLTNANLGAKIYADALQHAAQVNPDADALTLLQMAASAYNGGYRPSLGFGYPVSAPTTVCLRTDPTTGQCLQPFTAQPGQYGNQGYVDNFTGYFEQEGGDFGSWASYGGGELLPPITISGAAIGLGLASWLAIAGVVFAGWFFLRRRHG